MTEGQMTGPGRAAGSHASSAGSGDKLTVLFMAANPRKTTALRLGEEVRTIEERLREGSARDRYVLRQAHALRWTDLSRLLLEYRPNVVHFAGHGERGGELVFERERGEPRLVDPQVVAELFRILKDDIRCVVLNACWSKAQAEAINEHIDFVIGMREPVEDPAAIDFAAGFYRGLAFDRSVKTAFELGCNEVEGGESGGGERLSVEADGNEGTRRQGGHRSSIPELLVRPGADAGHSLFDSGENMDLVAKVDEDTDLAAKLDTYLGSLVTRHDQALRERYVALAGQIESRLRGERSSLDIALGSSTARPGTRQDRVARLIDEMLPSVMGHHVVSDPSEPSPGRVLAGTMPSVASDAASDEPSKAVQDVCGRLAMLDRAVLLGEPGSGKTWTLSRLTVLYADEFGTERKAEDRDAPIPVFLPLRSFDGTEGEGEYRKLLTFADFARRDLEHLDPHIDRLIREGRLVFLCDALNEMPRTSPLDGRELLPEVVAFLKQTPRFVVSCRTRDYHDDLGPLEIRNQLQLRDLDPVQIRDIVQFRYAGQPELAAGLWAKMEGSDELLEFWKLVRENDGEAAFWEKTTDWWHHLPGDDPSGFPWAGSWAWCRMHEGARLIPLARNPYLLDVIGQIYDGAADLPGNRAGLFSIFVKVLLTREEEGAATRGAPWPDGHGDRIHAALVRIAAVMQEGATTILAPDRTLAATGSADGGRLLSDAAASSLLVAESDGWRFAHQLLQEYFAVRIVLAALEGEDGDATPSTFFEQGEGWWDPGPWRETLVILGEFLNESGIGPNRVARWLAPVSPEVALDVIRRNGEGLTLDDVEPETREALIAAARALSDEPDPRGRSVAWRVLGELGGDNRPGVGLRGDGLPDIVETMCWIEPGTVVIEEGVGARTVDKPFQIARYPVTYAQYRAFVKAQDGYLDRRWWDKPVKLADREDEPGKQEWPIDNHPAESVSWYDAMAFCRWLTARLRDAGDIDAEIEIRLPTEAEWQLAAGGPEGWTYPWGPTYEVGRANVDESGATGGTYLKRTTAVGIYPLRAALHGSDASGDHGLGVEGGGAAIFDLSGNVWEWTLSERQWGGGPTDGSHDDLSSARPRVVRGGSWYVIPTFARAAQRHYGFPDSRNWYDGFRVVLAAPVS